MNLTNYSTPATTIIASVSTDRAAQAPDLRDNIATAQRAADLAYEEWQAAGATPEELADVYHAIFVETMDALGTPMPCACAGCAGLRGEGV